MNSKEEKIKVGVLLRKLTEKDIFFITTIIYFSIILLYELFYCNYEFFSKVIENYNFSIYRIILYIGIFAVFCKFKDKFIKSALSSFESEIKCYFTYIILALTLVLSIMLIVYIYVIQKNILNIVVLLISFLLFNLFAIYISNNLYKNIIVMALIFGTIFSISIPFNNQLDEKRHFLSSYSIALGNLNLKNAIADESIISMPRQMTMENFVSYFNEKPSGELTRDFSGKEVQDTPNDFYYYTITYFISGIGIFIAKTLGR